VSPESSSQFPKPKRSRKLLRKISRKDAKVKTMQD
jgi:hypothetical protein